MAKTEIFNSEAYESEQITERLIKETANFFEKLESSKGARILILENKKLLPDNTINILIHLGRSLCLKVVEIDPFLIGGEQQADANIENVIKDLKEHRKELEETDNWWMTAQIFELIEYRAQFLSVYYNFIENEESVRLDLNRWCNFGFNFLTACKKLLNKISILGPYGNTAYDWNSVK